MLLPLRKLIVASFFLLFPASASFAQITESTLRGTVLDGNGNVVVSSAVTVQSDTTGQSRTTKTDNGGSFTLAGLSPGSYTVTVRTPGFKTFEQRELKLNVGQTTEINIALEVGEVEATVQIGSSETITQVSTEGRVSSIFTQQEVVELPLAQRDVFLLPKLSAGATAIPGAANSTKLTNSPVITVNGNRYRGNNYVLDGAMNTNPNNTGEPAIVPNIESIEEVQVQTNNFSAEFGRGNGAVVNMRTKSGANDFHGKAWLYHRNAALNARNFFAAERAPQVFNQYGGNIGGPIFKNKTFFFGSYEGTRNALARTFSFEVETPELRNYVFANRANTIAARLLRDFPAPIPLAGSGNNRYVNQTSLCRLPVLSAGELPETCTPNSRYVLVPAATGRASVNLKDFIRFDQYIARIDHSLTDKDKITGRFISEYQKDEGGTSSAAATLGRAVRGSRGPFDGVFSNINLGHVHIFKRAVNDIRFAFQFIRTTRGDEDAIIPDITINGITAPFGDVFVSSTRLRTYELRDTLSLERGNHAFRLGGEFRRIFKGISIGPPTAGAFAFNNLLSFVNNTPFRQTITVNPDTGQPTNFPRYFTLYEYGLFVQDDWRVNSRLNLNLGVRYDHLGDAKEREGRLSSIILGPGTTLREQVANAAVGRVDRLYTPEKLNFSPRIGIAYDPFGDSKTSIRAGFSMAFQPHHGQSIAGARALPPDAAQVVSQPSARIGTQILYGIPVPFNPEFARGLNPQGGINRRLGEPQIRPTGFVVNPTIKTQYSESFFVSVQRQLGKGWIAETGYSGTLGVNLERIDDVNRFSGDLLDGIEDRINPNFQTLLFVTNGVNSSYHGGTLEVRRGFSNGFSLTANYRFSKWLDTSSDTSTGQFQDNSEPGKGAQDIACLRCEKARSLFDIPHRFSASLIWTPQFFKGKDNWISHALDNWQISSIVTAQSGRPFSVWNGANAAAGGDYNRDGGGGAVGGGFYDRPNAPVGINTDFNNDDFLRGLFPVSAFPTPVPGQNGNLGRNTFRGPRFATLDLSLSRSFAIKETKQIQVRIDAFNALNTLNLFLPNVDLSVGNFGKSTQAFEARTIQASLKFVF